MIWHPLTLCLWLLDLSTWMVYLSAAGRILAGLPGWQPGVSDRRQLWREFRLELAGLQGRWILALQSFALLVFITVIAIVWPIYVPGAMCGKGVLQAMGSPGYQAVFLRIAAVGCIWGWHAVSTMDADDPQGRLTALCARLLLLVGPLLFAADLTVGRGLVAIRPDHPVSCCSAIYDQTAVFGELSPVIAGLTPGVWMVGCVCGWIVVCCWGFYQWRRPRLLTPAVCLLMSGLSFCWMVTAVLALKFGFTSYIYEILSHPCLWCLFLVDHHMLGFLLFGLLGWAAFATLSSAISVILAVRYGHLGDIAGRRVKRAGCHLFLASLMFMVIAAGPALLWRMRFGGWL